jgi:polyisoprenoid-binding protein YceI
MKANQVRIAGVSGLLATLAFAIALPASAATTTFQIDTRHSDAAFGVNHMMISTVRGQFHGITGTVVIDDSDITKSTVNVTIDANTVDTQEPDRDKDLKSPKFFDVAKYPTITFKSTKVEKVSDGKLKITGDLTIHGVTKQVVLDATAPKKPIKDPWGLQRSAVSATTKVDRKDFGLTWNQSLDAGGVLIGDDVNINLDVEMVIPPPAK